MKQVQDRLVQMWEDEKAMMGEGTWVVWKWWDWVESGEFLSDLGLLRGDELE